MREAFHIPVARACRLAAFSRATWYRLSTAKDQSALRLRIRELAMARLRFGYQKIHILLRREGWRVNKKRVRRRKYMALHRGRRRYRRAFISAGAWTSCTISSSMVAPFGCSRWSISEVG